VGRAILLACLPWFALLVGLTVCLVLLVRTNGARFHWGRLGKLHRDQVGSVQGLSFVLTLPLFIMVVLLVVQVSQLMIGQIVVEYAAYTAARSAVVWIPANVAEPLPGWESENRISWYAVDADAENVYPILDPTHPDYGPTVGGVTYLIAPGSLKYEKIKSAAILACAPICPSRDLGLTLSGEGQRAAAIVQSLYRSMVPDYEANARIPRRIENKLAYAMRATEVEIRFFHSNRLPPLAPGFLPDYYAFNEVGWQDPITVKVKHWMALLPGPGRLLFRTQSRPGGSPDEVGHTIQREGNVYVYRLEASATLGNEGQKSVASYVHWPY
jgi:hypothetical protein